jgi:hypothetical protein
MPQVAVRRRRCPIRCLAGAAALEALGRRGRGRRCGSSGCAGWPRAFELSPLDVELLLVALAPDLEPRFERLYGYLHDDVSRRRASIGLALELCGRGRPGRPAGPGAAGSGARRPWRPWPAAWS